MVKQVFGKGHRRTKIINKQMIPLVEIVMHQGHNNIVTQAMLTNFPPCLLTYVDTEILNICIGTIGQCP